MLVKDTWKNHPIRIKRGIGLVLSTILFIKATVVIEVLLSVSSVLKVQIPRCLKSLVTINSKYSCTLVSKPLKTV